MAEKREDVYFIIERVWKENWGVKFKEFEVKNSQISLFFEIISETKLEFDTKLKFSKIKLLKKSSLGNSSSRGQKEKKKKMSQQLWPPIPREPDKRKKKEEPTPGRIRNKT